MSVSKKTIAAQATGVRFKMLTGRAACRAGMSATDPKRTLPIDAAHKRRFLDCREADVTASVRRVANPIYKYVR